MKANVVMLMGALLALPAAAQGPGSALKDAVQEVDPAPTPDPPKHETYEGSREFEMMKALVGKWTGKMRMGSSAPETDINVEYRLVAGGSAIEERTFAGTPKEMITMYHDKNGKLALTHYCMLHNQPEMILKSADEKSIHFDFDPSCSIDPDKEMHMHSLVLTFVDDDTVEQAWSMYADGEEQEPHPVRLKRVK